MTGRFDGSGKMRQRESLLISVDGAEEWLSSLEKAKILVVSDSHGSRDILFEIVRQFGETVSALCFCGDGVNDVLSLLCEQEKVELSKKIPPVVALVQGNGDSSTGSFVSDERVFVHVPVQLEFFVAQQKIFLTHGHRYNVYMGTKMLREEAQKREAFATFYGHTHISNAQVEKRPFLLNPGSCALPRGGMPHTFAIVTISKNAPIEYRYFEINWGEDGEIEFKNFNPPTEEVSLLW